MKRRSKHQLLVALSACLLLPVSNPGLADEPADTPDTSNWVCKLCPISGGWMSEWDLGLIYVDDPTPKFADYRGLIDEGGYLEASGESRYRNEKGHYFDFYGRNLGLDSRALEMRGGKQGTYELRADYRETPRYMGHGTVTPYAGVGTDTLVLPEAWQPSSGMTAWSPAKLENKRKTLGAGFTIKMGSAWKVNADVEQQKRDGTRSFSGGLFAVNGAIFPGPLDYTTQLLNASVEYAGKRGQLRLAYAGSDFENGYSSVTWDNPFVIGWGDKVSRSALAPDNKYQQISLAGAWRISPRFRISGKAFVGKAEQNVAFLPYSINPEYEDMELPRASLDGKVDTSMYNLSGRVYIRLADRLDLTAQYKVNERDNKTPVDIYTPILLEVLPSSPRSNRPYSYDRSQGKLELRYRPRYNIRLNAGLKRDTLERTYQDVLKTEEDSYWGEIEITSWSWFGSRLKLESLRRDARGFEEQGNYDRAENPLMRKFNMVDRDRNRLTLEFDLMPSERFDIALSLYTTEDEYDKSLIGLTESEATSINLDFNYILNEHTNLYAFITRDNIESEMSGADGAGALPWDAFTEDEILTWGLGISGRINKWNYGFDYVSSDADGDILTDSGAGEAPFPVLTTSLRNARVYVKYAVSERWGLGLDAYREEYDSHDWYVDGLGPLDINGILTMGELSPDYDVNVISLFAILRF
jgi:MtrB/PioB family decaheme-associated outer membrane protein